MLTLRMGLTVLQLELPRMSITTEKPSSRTSSLEKKNQVTSSSKTYGITKLGNFQDWIQSYHQYHRPQLTISRKYLVTPYRQKTSSLQVFQHPHSKTLCVCSKVNCQCVYSKCRRILKFDTVVNTKNASIAKVPCLFCLSSQQTRASLLFSRSFIFHFIYSRAPTV